MSGIADYTNRTVDVLAFSGAQPSGETLLSQALAQFQQGGEICTGVQKLAQRFVLELFTDIGSMPYLPARGTDFVGRALRGEFRSQADVLVAFSSALIDIRNNLQAAESATDSSDERYASAEVLSIAVLPGIVKLYINVVSLAGSSRKVILPLGTVLGGGL